MRLFDAPDVPQTWHWAAWLAYADVLTDAGDPRGEAIRLEHRCATEGTDPALPAAAYADVERQLGLDGLRADGSWRFTWSRGFVDEACFRLAEDTRSQRRDLVDRLTVDLPHTATVDPTDPERWEGVLIDALLSHPVAHRLRDLELHLTDWHHSAEHAAAALANRIRPRLERLHFGYDFELLYAPGKTSTGGRIDPLDHHHTGLVRTDVWRALPTLRTLELEGAFLFGSVCHDGVRRLRVRGPVVSDGALFELGDTPGVTSLEVEIGTDVFGCLCPVDQLDELRAADYPALEHLDLSEAEFDASPYEVLATLAESSVVPRLRSLTIGELTIEREDIDGDPSTALAELVGRFAHLDLIVDGIVDVEGVDDEEVERLLAASGPKPNPAVGGRDDD
ncbi:hypothetical protein [Embleya hyalina]|uniref:hypothetical protein n=1 Tax=Embleya hyalina TaxID=516124 RepID=UPI001581DF94|nr:hypothetical protein [Embleya hyalina]